MILPENGLPVIVWMSADETKILELQQRFYLPMTVMVSGKTINCMSVLTM